MDEEVKPKAKRPGYDPLYDGRKWRKRRIKMKRKPRPDVAARWADPEYREKMRLHRLAHPEKYFRRGVPDGMRKEEAMQKWAEARVLANKVIAHMVDTGQLPVVAETDYEVRTFTDTNGLPKEVRIPMSDEAKAQAALTETFALAYSPMANHQTKLACLRTVLEFTKQKPTQKQDVTVKSAEDYLDLIAKEVNGTAS